MKKCFIIFFNSILLLLEIKYYLFSECDRTTPFLKNNNCISSCTTEELKTGICIIENEIIKTQWLNNIINIGQLNYLYINIESSENDNLYCLVSSFPTSNVRKIYILNKEGYGLFNKTNPFINLIINDPNIKGRYESEISAIKLFSDNDNKEYLLSISKGSQFVELYDLYENNIFFNNVSSTFGQLRGVFTVVGPHLKLYSNENKNIYLFGILGCEYGLNSTENYFYLIKTKFTNLNISNNLPTTEIKKTKCSDSKIVSCFETRNNFIICFYHSPDYEYIIIVYSNDLIEKTKLVIHNGNPEEGYEDLFFKCIHFFDETGVFSYFQNKENHIIYLQFKKYSENNNTIENTYSFRGLTFDNCPLNNEKVTSCNMIKITDKKIFFIGVSEDKTILYIISLFNYYKENFVNKYYSIEMSKLYNYNIDETLRVTLYKNFLVLGSNYYDTNKDKFSTLIIFNYPNTTEVDLDLVYYLSTNNDTVKINNLTLELNGKYEMENNIFGYIYSGIQIIENCNGLEDIYLAKLDNEKIIKDYFLTQKEKIKLIIPKKNIYEKFTCKFKYAVVVTEPDYSEYIKYPIKIKDNGEIEKEENFFDKNKKNYIGKYSSYNLNLSIKLTEINCNDIKCGLCHFDDKNICITYIDNDILTEYNSIDSYNIINEGKKNYNEIIKDIRNNNIENIITDSLIENIIKQKKDLIIKDDENNVIYQITTTENQNNTNTNNISRIILGECEGILKDVYNIDENETLIIFKIDYFKPDSLIPIIGYEIFHPKNKSKLDLNYCKNGHINLNIPVNIDEGNLIKYDPKSEYYTDDCYPYTTENGTDILINDRHIEYNDNNMSLCEKNCDFIGYENNIKEAKCECSIKSKQIVISEIMNQTDLLYYDNFTDKNLTTNMASMKCYNTLFTKDGLLTNIGSYLLLLTIILFSISGIFVYKCGYNILEMDINELKSSKEKTKNNPTKKIKKKIKKKKEKNKNSQSLKINQNILSPKNINIYSLSKSSLNNSKNNYLINSNKSINKVLDDINYNDYELNFLSYNAALKYDRRTFFEQYLSLFKVKHPLIFSFFPQKDYNLFIIKIDLFFLSLIIYYFINALFFNESAIHKIYKEKGVYNFGSFIPQIIYSFIISYFLCNLIKYLSLSGRNISEIKYKYSDDKVEKVKRILIIKFICFFVLGLIFLFFLWYYLSSFNAVYKNTQIYLIKNSLISFIISLIYPFIIILLISILRNHSLKDNNKECIYNICKILIYLG